MRKVEIHDVYDLKRWYWRANDGIRETTWPGVYNRSRLPGRNDYFQLPDWDCYSLSGKSVAFTMPDEPWNQIEVSGAAFGSFALGAPVFERPKGQERTFHRLSNPVRGGKLEFTNAEQETPIGELGAYYVTAAAEPEGVGRLTYRLTSGVEPDQSSVQPVVRYINGRYAPDERTTMVAVPPGAPRTTRAAGASRSLPIVHILIPSDFRDADLGARRARFNYSWVNINAGLDGIAIDLPALNVKPTHGAAFPLNIQVSDPDLAASQDARRERVGQTRRAPHDLAGYARPHPPGRQGAVDHDRGRGAPISGRPRSKAPRSGSSSRNAPRRCPSMSWTASPRCGPSMPTWLRNRRARAG